MGQSGSKPPGSLPFGHVAYLDTSSPATEKQHSTNDNDHKDDTLQPSQEGHEGDRLLSAPQQYGLSTPYCDNNNNNIIRYQYRPCTPPTPPTPLSFNFTSTSYPSSSSSTSSFSLFGSVQAKDHMDINKNNNNDKLPSSDWLTLMNDVTYVDATYYQKAPSNDRTMINTKDHRNRNPLPPLPSFTMTEKSLTTTDLKSIDKTMHVISLAQQNLIRLNPNIGLFTMICKLDLTNNKLTCLPDSIGYLGRLESLYVGNNQLDALPDTIGHLTKLIELDVSHNQLTTLTPCIAYLKKLQILIVSQNHIHELPVHLVVGLKGLTILDLSDNPISVLPAEITQLHFLRRLLLDGCPLVDPSTTTLASSSSSTTLLLSSQSSSSSPITASRIRKPPCYSLLHSPPSLLEQCARSIVRDTKRHSYYQQRFYQLSPHLVTYLYSATPCTLCQNPYFDTYVARGRQIERNGRWLPVEYRLCQAHFTTEDDRLLSMFSSEGTSSSSSSSSFLSTSMDRGLSWNQPYRPSLPALPKLTRRKSSLQTKDQKDTQQHKAALMMESVIQQQQQQEHTQDDVRMELFNNGWRAHRMKVMNKNQSGFLSLTKSSSHLRGDRNTDTPQHQQV
ncbi:hypothetical protein BC941DRAFT_381290 [Chlamydoabsidia padenii]|nr:hypothetical protein BC941DRAFT_381290 [Chlamydoabsidia padenii]